MKIAIIGASKDRSKYGNKAVRAYKQNDHVVFPINPSEREIEGLKCYSSVLEVPLDIEVASIYLPPEIARKLATDIIKKKVKTVYINPGAESKELISLLRLHGIRVIKGCSIRAIGVDPEGL